MPQLTCNIVWTGDSITAGNHVNPGECYPELVATNLPSIVSHNIAVPSAFLGGSTQAGQADALFDAGKQVNICSLLWGTNEGTSTNSTAFIALLAPFSAARRATGFKILLLSMLPCGSYASSAYREAINLTERTTSTLWDVFVDLGNSTFVMGAEAAKDDGSLYSDTVHPTAAGNLLIYPAVKNAILSLIGYGSVGFSARRF